MIAPLKRVLIENFRSIKSMQVELHPKVTVFFGANAAGKTTILQALAVGLGAVVGRVPKASGRDFAKTGDLRVPWTDLPDGSEKRSVERPFVRVVITAAGDLRWDVTRYRSVQDRPASPTALGVKALHEALDPVIKEALDAPPEALTRPLPLVAAYGTERAVVNVPLRERNFNAKLHRFDGLDHSLSAATRFKAVFEWFRVMEDEERRERERRKEFTFLLPELEWVRRAVEVAELRCKNPRVVTRPIRMLVDFDHGNGKLEPLDLQALSDGYRTHFALVVDIARRMVQLNPSADLDDKERGTRTEAVVLIDEVDLHLDPLWQGRVVRGLLAAFPNTQFVLTTHSEQVLGSVAAESVRKLVWGEGEIVVETVPFAQGATGERILVELMGAPERAPGPTTELLKQYTDRVDAGEGTGEEAKRLRTELDAALQRDPQLLHADLEMQRRELVKKLRKEPE